MVKILILGGGLMGPAAALNALADPDVSRVAICDVSQRQLDGCLRQFLLLSAGDQPGRPGAEKTQSQAALAVAILLDFGQCLGDLS